MKKLKVPEQSKIKKKQDKHGNIFFSHCIYIHTEDKDIVEPVHKIKYFLWVTLL